MKTLVVSACLAVMAQAAPVAASMTFPDELRRYYGVETLPAPGDGCTLCHTSDQGGPMTVTTQYGRDLMGTFNVVSTDLAKLRNGLQAAEAAGWDSDQDQIADADELRAGMSPNVFDGMGDPPPTLKEVPLPRTGCTMGSQGSASGWAISGVLVSLAWALRRAGQRRP